jgi:conjugal transfer pilus assembly protein TraF
MQVRRSYLRGHANEFALVMFSRSTCGYCRVQWPIVQRFQEEMGWQVTLMDIDRKRPELGQRFGVEITPTTMVIRRGSQQRMVIASGVEAYPNLIADGLPGGAAAARRYSPRTVHDRRGRG